MCVEKKRFMERVEHFPCPYLKSVTSVLHFGDLLKLFHLAMVFPVFGGVIDKPVYFRVTFTSSDLLALLNHISQTTVTLLIVTDLADCWFKMEPVCCVR